MAGRLILMKNGDGPIKGDCEAEGYVDQLKLYELSFSSVANVQHDSKSGSIHQTAVTFSLPFGPWVADFQQHLYHGKGLGIVDLVEIEQKVDASQKKVWKKIREFRLIDGWVESISHTWSGISASVSVSLQYTDVTFTWGDKVAHYNRSEK